MPSLGGSMRISSLGLSALTLACILACGGLSSSPSVPVVGGQAGLAGESHEVLALYGRLVQVDVTGTKIWFDVDMFDPPGEPQPIPPGDRCEYRVGDEVEVDGFEGTVGDVHGKMMAVSSLWYLCAEGKAVAPPPAARPPPPSPSYSRRAAEITQCKRGCNRQCDNAPNKSKCIGRCRRACDG